MAPELNDLSDVLRQVHAQNLVAYQRLLHQSSSNSRETTEPSTTPPDRFWDIVVVTACDVQQRLSYQKRIDDKLARGQIPRQAKYHVIEDPPKSKIGSGGSTLLVMKILQEQYSAEFLSNARTLLIHAGGYSTRLPHVSARGKVFMAIPQANAAEGIQVLDLKLLLYLHLLKSMPPGVLLTSADGIELFASSTAFPSDAKPGTITALAHPSSLEMGSLHGVYLLDDPSVSVQADVARSPREQEAFLLKCRQFLHKPSIETMLQTPHVVYKGDTRGGSDVVYTDSCYYFDPQTAKVMAETYSSLSQVCDLEAWADILSFQDGFIQDNNDNIESTPHEDGCQVVKRAFREAGIQMDVMILNASKFYHLGTMQEFVEATCLDPCFMSELAIRNDLPGIALVATEMPVQEVQWVAPVYVEGSRIRSGVELRAWSIMVDTDLGVHAGKEEEEGEEDGLVLLENTCIFTLQLQEQGVFVTFTFSIKDDMKKTASASASFASGGQEDREGEDDLPKWTQDLQIFETVPVQVMFPSDQKPPTSVGATVDESSLSLWTAPIFETAKTKEGSIQLALERLGRIQDYQRRCQEEDATLVGTQVLQASNKGSVEIQGWISLKDAARIAR